MIKYVNKNDSNLILKSSIKCRSLKLIANKISTYLLLCVYIFCSNGTLELLL